jgi:hypothetical protein
MMTHNEKEGQSTEINPKTTQMIELMGSYQVSYNNHILYVQETRGKTEQIQKLH